MSMTLPNADDPQGDDTSELRQKLIEKYIEIAASFYYEGSDEIVERNKYAPEFADEILSLLSAQRQQWEVAARKDEANNWNQALTTAVYDEYSTGVPQSEPNKWLVEWANKRIATLDSERGKEQ